MIHTNFIPKKQKTVEPEEIELNENLLSDTDDENSANFRGRRSEPDEWYDPEADFEEDDDDID